MKNGFLLYIVLFVTSCSPQVEIPPLNKTFDGSSQELKSTRVVPALDAPLRTGQNAIWCASFLAAWKTLEGIAQGDVHLEGEPAEEELLNKASDPRPSIPKGSLYVAVGSKQNGIVEKIQNELKQVFPRKPAPAFPGIADDSFLAYSYLEANVKFWERTGTS
jgi:hypothetical protein